MKKDKNRVSKELGIIGNEIRTIDKEIKDLEIREAFAKIENRHNFNLGLILGLVFAVVAGFFSIVAHEIFILQHSYIVKLVIVLLSLVILILCLIIGLIENKTNKDLRKKVLDYMEKREK